MSTHEQVLSEFIDAWNQGHRPRVREYLARLPDGPERDELAEQITSWLEVAPTPSYDEETRDEIRREPIVASVLSGPVPALRARAGLSISELAAVREAREVLTGSGATAGVPGVDEVAEDLLWGAHASYRSLSLARSFRPRERR